MRRDQIVAHRGNAAEVEENTIAAVRSAIDLGCKFVEVDVHLSCDGVPVLIHDEYLTSRIKRHERVATWTSYELRAKGIDWLSDLVALLWCHPDVTAFIELKAGRCAEVCAVLDSIREQCVIISFRPDDLRSVPVGFRTGIIVNSQALVAAAMSRPVDFVFADKKIARLLPPDNLCVYEIGDADEAGELPAALYETMQVRKLLEQAE